MLCLLRAACQAQVSREGAKNSEIVGQRSETPLFDLRQLAKLPTAGCAIFRHLVASASIAWLVSRGKMPKVVNGMRALALTLGVLLCCGVAQADAPPGVWERAKSPDARLRYEVHRKVRERLARGEDWTDSLSRPFVLGGARLLLEDLGVEQLDDARLLFDYGEVLEELGEHVKAAAVLERALALDPQHPGADMGRLTLAFAYAREDRSEDELRAYQDYLRHTDALRGRATAQLNMAEAHMRVGRLDEAVSGYREAYRTATDALGPGQSADTAALACWGLAVALDRLDETVESRRELDAALSFDRDMALIQHSPNVFFVPAYERSYYVGLGYEGRARRDADDPLARRAAIERALGAFREYVSRATPTDRWKAQAREHVRRLELEHKKLPPAPRLQFRL